jgi:tripartite-type tricarboxylate transporter receptor subunit TctC
MIVSLRATLGLLAACVLLHASDAAGQEFPVAGKPVRIVVPFPPGGTSDFHARYVASKLTHALGVAVGVDNKPGASTIHGALEVAKAAPDGHTVLYMLSLSVAGSPHLHSKLPYDVQRDFTPLTYASRGATVLAVSASLPVKNVLELVEHAKRHPGKLVYGSWSAGGTGHLNGELLKSLAGIDMAHVAFKGSADLVQALASGQVHLAFDGLLTAASLAKAGKARILAVADEARFAAIPEVPTMAEAGLPGHYAWGGYHFLGPAKLPRQVVERWNAELTKVLRMPETRDLYLRTGMEIVASTPEEQARILRAQSERLGTIIRKLGMTLD